jgi:hypothetical protein
VIIDIIDILAGVFTVGALVMIYYLLMTRLPGEL